ncbi:MAG TPA: AMP-binding protein [Herpetosiphonaceae bacterium]
MNIAFQIEQMALEQPDALALCFEEARWTYRQLNEQANRFASVLETLGVVPGDRVALMLPNIPAFVWSYLGILKCGAIAVSINNTLTTREVRIILNDCRPVAAIATPEAQSHFPRQSPYLLNLFLTPEDGGLGVLDALMAGADPELTARDMAGDAPAAIVYSSGTTGTPKGVTLSHNNVLTNMAAKRRYCGMRPDDRLLLCVPLYHCFGQNAILNSGLAAGATIILLRRFEPESALAAIARHAITMVFGVPTMYRILLERAEPGQLASVRYYFSGAAILPPSLARAWHARFGRVINEGYGLTETSPFAAYNHESGYKFGSVGTPIERVRIKIVDVESGLALGPGQVGEIAISGPNVMLGYWNMPEETAQVIRDGWFHTGDLGTLDADGYLYLVDRLKDMINVAGMKVYPAEVEQVLYQHPVVAEAAVYGVADDLSGERVEASIVAREPLPLRELMKLCRAYLAPFKIPTAIHMVDSIPKNATGKPLKRVLREAAAAEQANAAQAGGRRA